MKKAQIQVETAVAAEDVDDIVEIASELMIEDEDNLSLEQMKEVGEELDIPAEYIERAQAELATRRQAEKVAEVRARAEADTRKKIAIGAGVGGAALFGIVVAMSVSSVSTAHKNVEAARAQVDNVLERKQAIVQQYENRPDSVDKDAELTGAENRIRVETKRYAEAAAEYNAAASGPIGGIAATVLGLPSDVPVKP